MQIIERLEAKLQGPARPREFDEDLRTLRPRLQLASGDLKAAAQWADQILSSEEFQSSPDLYQVTLARVRLAQGRYADVEALLASSTQTAGAGNRVTRQIEIHLLRAAALAGQKRMPEAFDMVKTSLFLAEPEGCIRAFLNSGQPALDLLAAYLRTGPSEHQSYAQKVLSAWAASKSMGPSGLQPEGLIEPLSAREQEVLHLMALGKTNQEIADQLVVARGTIKAHAATIYRKLDAANRTEAVARARQLGILP
jgi:LuxR family transcriptional regulator, maltose regulon positive regulatory protein